MGPAGGKQNRLLSLSLSIYVNVNFIYIYIYIYKFHIYIYFLVGSVRESLEGPGAAGKAPPRSAAGEGHRAQRHFGPQHLPRHAPGETAFAFLLFFVWCVAGRSLILFGLVES